MYGCFQPYFLRKVKELEDVWCVKTGGYRRIEVEDKDIVSVYIPGLKKISLGSKMDEKRVFAIVKDGIDPDKFYFVLD